VDYEAAWCVLQNKTKSSDFDGLLALLDGLGIESGGYLQHLDEPDLLKLAAMLKKGPRGEFLLLLLV
jgi:hypothetical protein